MQTYRQPSGSYRGSESIFKRVANSIGIVVSFLFIGYVLKLSPSFPEAIALAGAVSLALFLGIRAWSQAWAGVVFSVVFSIGAVFAFLGGNERAPIILFFGGCVIAAIYFNAHAFLDLAQRIPPQPSARSTTTVYERQQRALAYVFGTLNDGETFKGRIARENITALGYMSQREWREWVTRLEKSGVIECVNAQVTRPLVASYAEAENALRNDGYYFVQDEARPGVYVRTFNREN